MKPNGDEHDQDKGKPGGFQQHPPEWRREHLSKRLGGRVDHRRLPALVPAPWAPSLNKALLWRYRKHGEDEKRFSTRVTRVPWKTSQRLTSLYAMRRLSRRSFFASSA